MEKITLITSPITLERLKEIAEVGFGDMVKGVVDLEKGIMALGGELHADEEAYLLERSSKQEYLWGFNLYPDMSGSDMIEYDAMINIRPQQGNRSRTIEDETVRKKVSNIVHRLIIT